MQHRSLDVQKVLCYQKKVMTKVTAVQEHKRVLVEEECLGYLIELFLVDRVCG